MTTTTAARIGRSRRLNAGAAIADDAHTLGHDVADAVRHVSDDIGQQAGQVRLAVNDWLGQRAGQMQRAADRWRDRALEAGDRTREAVRSEPLKSVLIAAATGALLAGLAVFASRRR